MSLAQNEIETKELQRNENVEVEPNASKAKSCIAEVTAKGAVKPQRAKLCFHLNTLIPQVASFAPSSPIP